MLCSHLCTWWNSPKFTLPLIHLGKNVIFCLNRFCGQKVIFCFPPHFPCFAATRKCLTASVDGYFITIATSATNIRTHPRHILLTTRITIAWWWLHDNRQSHSHNDKPMSQWQTHVTMTRATAALQQQLQDNTQNEQPRAIIKSNSWRSSHMYITMTGFLHV